MARLASHRNHGPHNIRRQGDPMNQPLTHTVTGATGYTGRYITRLLLEQGHTVQSITGHPERHNPFGNLVPLHPFNFDQPDRLAETLAGTDTLFNTYWIRVNYGGRTQEQCVEHTRVMFEAAKAAGVRRIVHISITNPDPKSDLPYFRGKGQLEDKLRDLGVSYAILRPTVLYSTEDILINNIAWTLRRFPLVLLPGNGPVRHPARLRRGLGPTRGRARPRQRKHRARRRRPGGIHLPGVGASRTGQNRSTLLGNPIAKAAHLPRRPASSA